MSRNDSTYHRLLNTKAWRVLRAGLLEKSPFCRDCERKGIVAPATEVHHLRAVERVKDPERMRRLAYDPANCVCLCHPCHMERHRQMRSQSRSERQQRARATARAFVGRYCETGGPKKTKGGGGPISSPRDLFTREEPENSGGL